MATHSHLRAEKGPKCLAGSSLGNQLSSLSNRSQETGLPSCSKGASQVGHGRPEERHLTAISCPSIKQGSSSNASRNKISRGQRATLSRKVPGGSPAQSKRNVAVSSSSMHSIELDWLPSENSGYTETSFQITLEVLIAPKSGTEINSWHFSHHIVGLHNQQVSSLYPRMRHRDYCEEENPECWVLTLIGRQNGPPTQTRPVLYQLQSPYFKSSDPWQEWYEATWTLLRKDFIVKGVNVPIPAVMFSVHTSKRALDFKRILQALIHFNTLWPSVLKHEESRFNNFGATKKPFVVAELTYFSHHPDYWSAIPARGFIAFRLAQASEAGERSALWAQFVIAFVEAAISSKSLEFIQIYPVTLEGLNAFIVGSVPKNGKQLPKLPFLL